MFLGKMRLYCLGIMTILVCAQLYAGGLNATGSAQIYLSDDNWTIDKTSMYVTNAKNCTAVVKYDHDGKYKTIGSCTYEGSESDVRGDFSFDFGTNVLFADNSAKGFSLKAKGVSCHYQLQTMGPPTFNYYYRVDCKLSDANVAITPFGGACSQQSSVDAVDGQDGVMLKPVCK